MSSLNHPPLVAPPPKQGDDWFSCLASSTSDAVLIADGERVVFANRAAAELTGRSLDHLIGHSPLGLLDPAERDAARQRLTARLEGLPVEPTITIGVRRPDGEIRQTRCTASLIELEDGRPGVLFSGQDLTGRGHGEKGLDELQRLLDRAERSFERERERAQVTLAAIGDGVVRTDADGRVDMMNPVAERLLGRPVGEMMGRPLDDVYHRLDEATAKPLASPVGLCLAQRRRVESTQRCVVVRSDGEERVVRESAAPIFDRDGALAGAVLVIRDLTTLSGMEREVSYFATHDPLTGLLHRRELERRLARHLEAGADLGVLIHVDVDEFRVVNDLCGHNAGDELLREVAERLFTQVGEAGVVARIGADEFGVLLPRAEPDAGCRHAEELREAITAQRFRWQEDLFDVRVSVGLVSLAGADGGPAQVLTAAEVACLAAKDRGRDRVHEYQPHDQEIAQRHGEMQWIHRIRRAFDEDLFCLHRQPIRPLTEDGEEGLCEVLIRMRDDDGRLVAPGAFIPAAERYHLIPAIDRWVVRTALAGLAEENGHAGCLALNVSGLSLSDEGFLDDVSSALETSGVDPRRLCFEITETAAVAHLAHAQRFMAVLRAQGCRFVLDDFGSGMSSFAYLKNLPVDFLKISSQFVRGIEESALQRALVQSIHQIGALMRMGTIAEGVETEPALLALREVGVHYAQGFWIGRPQPM